MSTRFASPDVLSSQPTSTHAVPPLSAPPNNALTTAILEGFSDGLLILTLDGHLLHANRCGQRLCQELTSEATSHPPVPEPIWLLCCQLIESRELFPNNIIILEDEFTSPSGRTIRARVQWFTPHGHASLLVTLDDRTRLSESAALLEARRFQLTPRETEVWLLRKANNSYEAIAKQLFITINTVKRHLKSIYAKRSQVLEGQAS